MNQASGTDAPPGEDGLSSVESAEAAGSSEAPPPPEARPLPNLHEVDLGDGRTAHILGTAHVSKASVDDVIAACEQLEPDTICVELCPARFENIRNRESWKQLDIFKVLREGKAPLLLSSLVMTAFQRRIADELGVVPGAEMIEGIEQAERRDCDLVLADRDIQTTLRRTWRRLGLWTRLKMISQLVGSLFVTEELAPEDIEKLKQGDELEDMLAGMARAFPAVKETLIDERDLYLATKVRAAAGSSILAVVGAGHVPGMLGEFERSRNSTTARSLTELDEVPPPSIWPKLLQWAIPGAILALLVFGFLRGGAAESLASAGIWVLVNGALTALGAAAALGHPLTILAAFVAAPLTSLNPMIAAGWVSGLVQAWIKRPRVEHLEQLPNDITSLRGYWANPVLRVLLVVMMSNLGSMLGTFVAGSMIAARTL